MKKKNPKIRQKRHTRLCLVGHFFCSYHILTLTYDNMECICYIYHELFLGFYIKSFSAKSRTFPGPQAPNGTNTQRLFSAK